MTIWKHKYKNNGSEALFIPLSSYLSNDEVNEQLNIDSIYDLQHNSGIDHSVQYAKPFGVQAVSNHYLY